MGGLTRGEFVAGGLAFLVPTVAMAKVLDYSELDGMSAAELEELQQEVETRLKAARAEEQAASGKVDFQSMTAEEIVLQMRADGMPITDYVAYDETTDTNQLLGRPGGYTSKVNFNDISLGYDPGYDISNGGSVEVFTTAEGAEGRASYIESMAQVFSTMTEYHYTLGNVLLRLSQSYTPAQAAEWEQELNNPAGNASGGASESDFQLMQMAEQAWRWNDDGYGVSDVIWCATASNPNAGLALNYVLFEAIAYAEDGTQLGSSTASVSEAWPSSTVAVSGFMGTNGVVPARVEVTVKGGSLIDNWHAADLADRQALSVANLVETVYYERPAFSGSIENSTELAVNAEVTVITRNEEGALVDVMTGKVDNIPAYSWQDFTISPLTSLAAYAQLEVYAEAI